MNILAQKNKKYLKLIGASIFLLLLNLRYSKYYFFRLISIIPVAILFYLFGNRIYPVILNARALKNRKKLTVPSSTFSSNSDKRLKLFIIRVLTGKYSPIDAYNRILKTSRFSAQTLHDFIHVLMSAGRLDLARETSLTLIEHANELSLEERLKMFRSAGTVSFLLGKNREANLFWRKAGELRRTMFSPSTPREYRILGSSWFGAVGHIAMLDYYLKYKRLYGQENCRVVSTASTGLDCSNFLSRKFADMGIHFIHPSELEADYNKWADKHGAPQWQALLPQERAALIDDFWEHDFPDGEILSYTHAAARIQKEWEEAGNDPLLKVSENERKWLSQYLEVIGLPKNAWYVCLHVREGGYHKDWNAKYPSMRDCEIEDYYSSIHAITEAGGWVIRMGDSSMKKLPPMENVVDYAHCNVKQPAADVLIAASCRFFLGTNSGFATIPATYGVPCALSNWVPIGWPLWPSQDLMICKLFRKKETKQLLSLPEIFERGLAFLQNWSELPSDVEIFANTKEEILDLTNEMLSKLSSNHFSLKKELSKAQKNYAQLAKLHETFASSQFADFFVEKYPDVFSFEESENAEAVKTDCILTAL